jgi:hypothetical protein
MAEAGGHPRLEEETLDPELVGQGAGGEDERRGVHFSLPGRLGHVATPTAR